MKRREVRRLFLTGKVRRNGLRISVNDSLKPVARIAVRGVVFEVVNGAVSSTLPPGHSLTDDVNQVPEEDALGAEIELRRYRLESMMPWPEKDDRMMVVCYEAILGRKAENFREILNFLGQSRRIAEKDGRNAHAYRVWAKEAKKGHLRNPQSGQWRDRFAPQFHARFVELYKPLLIRYGYPFEGEGGR